MFEDARALPTPAIIVGLAAVPLLAVGAFVIYRVRRQPKDKEKLRRMAVNLHGRLGDATITEVADNCIYYSYSVGGVLYTASQDISQLAEHMPEEPERLAGGTASLKYWPQNPANSIVLCEEWSGLRTSRPVWSYQRKQA